MNVIAFVPFCYEKKVWPWGKSGQRDRKTNISKQIHRQINLEYSYFYRCIAVLGIPPPPPSPPLSDPTYSSICTTKLDPPWTALLIRSSKHTTPLITPPEPSLRSASCCERNNGLLLVFHWSSFAARWMTAVAFVFFGIGSSNDGGEGRV